MESTMQNAQLLATTKTQPHYPMLEIACTQNFIAIPPRTWPFSMHNGARNESKINAWMATQKSTTLLIERTKFSPYLMRRPSDIASPLEATLTALQGEYRLRVLIRLSALDFSKQHMH